MINQELRDAIREDFARLISEYERAKLIRDFNPDRISDKDWTPAFRAMLSAFIDLQMVINKPKQDVSWHHEIQRLAIQLVWKSKECIGE